MVTLFTLEKISIDFMELMRQKLNNNAKENVTSTGVSFTIAQLSKDRNIRFAIATDRHEVTLINPETPCTRLRRHIIKATIEAPK